MAWERLNKDDAGLADNAQAQFDRTDAWSLVPRNAGDGVLEGLAPTTAGTDMDIDLSAGWVQQSGVPVSIGAGAATIGTADVTNPRIDVIVIDTSTPSITVRAGTPAAAPESPTLTTGDIPIAEIFVAANDAALAADTITDLRVPVQLAPQIEVFEQAASPATYTKPAGATFVRAICIAAGSGGGSGRKGASSTDRYGGGGGPAGGVADVTFLAASVGATETVTIGAGGAGGAAVSANSTNGSAGSLGGSSSFGSLLSATVAGVGAGGTTTGGAGGGSGTPNNASSHIIGWQAGDGQVAANGGTGQRGSTGAGGGGGGIDSSNTARGGGAGGTGLGGAGGTGLGGAGGAGTDMAGGGGGGGGNAEGYLAQSVAAGGAGGVPGGGGGGGGAGIDSVADSGAGGAGGNGRVIIMTW